MNIIRDSSKAGHSQKTAGSKIGKHPEYGFTYNNVDPFEEELNFHT
jgi:hypothetical protein